jgi:hypothetical protein
MKVNCLSCGFKEDLGNAYDDYEGQIKCCTCGVILKIKTDQGAVKAVRLAKAKHRSLKKAAEERLV